MWKQEVLAIIRNHWGDGREFYLPQLYDFEDELASLHPGNRNIRPKIRQSLQYLRDARIVEFVDDRGSYRLKEKLLKP
jgi:type II restriction enzyme